MLPTQKQFITVGKIMELLEDKFHDFDCSFCFDERDMQGMFIIEVFHDELNVSESFSVSSMGKIRNEFFGLCNLENVQKILSDMGEKNELDF